MKETRKLYLAVILLCSFIFSLYLSVNNKIYAGEIEARLSYGLDEVRVDSSNGQVNASISSCKDVVVNGKSKLSVQDFYVLLPPSGIVTEIKITSCETAYIQEDRPELKDTDSKSFPPAKSFSRKTIEYMGEKWVDGRNVGSIRVYPLHYDSDKNSLALFTNIKFKIKYTVTSRSEA